MIQTNVKEKIVSCEKCLGIGYHYHKGQDIVMFNYNVVFKELQKDPHTFENALWKAANKGLTFKKPNYGY